MRYEFTFKLEYDTILGADGSNLNAVATEAIDAVKERMMILMHESPPKIMKAEKITRTGRREDVTHRLNRR